MIVKPPAPEPTRALPTPDPVAQIVTLTTSDPIPTSPTPPESAQPEIPCVTTTTEPSDETASVTSSEESFERVTSADLAEYEAVITESSSSPSAEGTPPPPETLGAAITTDDTPPEADNTDTRTSPDPDNIPLPDEGGGG